MGARERVALLRPAAVLLPLLAAVLRLLVVLVLLPLVAAVLRRLAVLVLLPLLAELFVLERALDLPVCPDLLDCRATDCFSRENVCESSLAVFY